MAPHGRGGLPVLSPLSPLQFKAGADAKSPSCPLRDAFQFLPQWSHGVSLPTASHVGPQREAGVSVSGS